ncbi:polyketide synthase [Streptomyces spiroverticillatus]|uniref:Polyketide synthase n=1 Tax=Streptomyces finlayi TaxID=67296 RepID=A0A918X845_9ACTN|nr:type I polyketide synthase [Streptomyces finlayi]GHA44067.1 polyketide synthase [Streptomyces spiroverticillatus]GHD17607.1 polyketide synthase [Streptomyces finlayi]
MDANAERAPGDLVAIVGMAGKFPGAPDVESLWNLMMEGGDGIVPVPLERWDSTAQLDPEREIQAVGGFLDGVDRFDAGFFGISPREAEAIDPQQRLMLEVGWRALEDAGQPAASLAGTRTGVYVGASWHDYELLRRERDAQPTPHSLVGNALDVIAARLSYFLKVRGPSMAVETGCSSSLVALHLACQALRDGEIDAAVVGGTNLLLDPHVTVGLTHFGALSPDGRCQAFSARANGFVRGEGVAALFVKTLERALADGDRIHGVVVNTVVNNDGGGDSLVTPSPEGQEDLLRRAYGGGVVPQGAPAYIEAHGTGTGRGDPIEATAIGRVLGADRAGDPLLIGSVKTNIGHLEAGAGLAGLFKILLALKHRTVPPSLHSAELNPAIAFDDLHVKVVREATPLPATGPLYLGVNSFGWGGTNAHVVITNPPQTTADPTPRTLPGTGLPAVLPLSAKDTHTLGLRAAELADPVPETTEKITARAGVLAHRRDHFPHRAALVAPEGPEQLRTGLLALAAAPDAAPTAPGLTTGTAVPRGGTAFVFPGQGSQWHGMGVELFRDSPLFASVVTRCAEALRPHTDWDLLKIFTGEADDAWTTRIDMLQPTLWAMSLGLAELWRASGVEPDVVLGHSQGEITAATLAGVLSYEDAALVMARRSAIARRTSGLGRMLAVDLDREAALAALEGFEDSVSLAVHNGPHSCVLSGEKEAVLTLRELLDAEDVYCRLVNVDYASHSPQMDPLREDLLAALEPVRPRNADIGLMSTVRRQRLDGPEMDGAYWVENLRSPVQFADAMGALLDEGITHVVEISPHAVLAPAVEQLVADRSGAAAVLTTMRRHHGSAADLAEALGRAYVAGLEPFGDLPRTADAPVPGYPLRDDRHWTAERPRGSGAARGFDAPLLPAAGDDDAWHAPLELSLNSLPWLADHQVHGTPVLPGAGMLAVAVNTAQALPGPGVHRWEKLRFRKEVALTEDITRLTAEWRGTGAGSTFRLLTLTGDRTGWEVNATVRADRRTAPRPAPGFPEWHAGHEPADTEDFYRTWAARGIAYGPAFRGIRTLFTDPAGERALAEVVLADRLRAGNRGRALHPALWDGALQASLALSDSHAPGTALVPTAVARVELLEAPQEPVTRVWSHVVRREEGRFDLQIFDGDHRPLLVMEGLELSPLPGGDIGENTDAERLHRIEWADLTADREAAAATGHWLVCTADADDARERGDSAAGRLADALTAAGTRVTRTSTDRIPEDLPDRVVFVAPDADAEEPAQRRALTRLAGLARACSDAPAPPLLTVVTTRAQAAVPTDTPDPGAALFWGFTRVLRREHAELRARIVDIDPADADGPADWAAELLTDTAEDQVALRSGRRLAARLTRGAPDADSALLLPPVRTPRQPFRAAARRPGARQPVEYLPLVRRSPQPGEIEIEITAVALDHGDAFRALGTPQPGSGPLSLGTGCAGRVVAVGPDVTSVAPGDRVAACAVGALASHLTVRADHAVRVPDALGDAEAAALPLPMAAAWYALSDLGRLQAGEAVLIDLPPGVAARTAVEQVSRVLGARIIATSAGSGQETTVVEPTDADWAATVRTATGGRGVDLVLAPPSGQPGDGRLDVLAPGGRYIAFGGTGGRALGAEAFSRGIALSTVALPGLLEDQGRRFASALKAVWELVADGKLEPLDVHTRPMADVIDALRETAAQGARGRRTVLVDASSVDAVTPRPTADGRFRADGSYLISGGLGALGLSLAEFLAAHGAGSLVLLGRSEPTPAAAARIGALRATGTLVRTERCDLTDARSVTAVLAAVRGELPPLRGVVHAAGLLEDATVRNLTPDQVERVLAPKTAGAHHLQAATTDDPLDFFVLFSSAAALVGNAGQAAYAAANSYLDAFAEARRRRGLAALSVQWGPFTEVGLAASDDRRGARLEERGMGGFSPDEAWPALVRMLERDEPVTGYVPLQLRQWFDAYPDTAALGSWERLHAAARSGSLAPQGGDFLAQLLAAGPEERPALAEGEVRRLAGRVLRLAEEQVTGEVPFKQLGLDSLMGLELRNRLEASFGLRLSPTLLWSYGTAKALADALCERLAETSDPSAPA